MVKKVKYTASSPWYSTGITDNALGTWVPRPIPASDDDYEYMIQPQYNYRPDLLSYDLYGNPKLWWVFMQRNLSVIKDPIYDFEPGTGIYIPKKNNLQKFLGI